MDNTKPRFTEKIAYGAGDFAFCLYWQMFSMFLLYFYTDIYGISAAAVGTMLLVTRLWDTVNDPLMGVIADRTTTRWGKFRPYLVLFALPMAVAATLTFTTPDLSPVGKIVYAYVTYGILMMVYTAINVPYASLLGVMTEDPDQKTSFATARMVGAQLGSMLVQATTIAMVARLGAGNEERGYQLTVVAFSLLGAALFFVTFVGTKERVQPMPNRSAIASDLGDLVRNGPWMVLFAVGFLLFVSISVRGASILYYFKYYVDDESAAAYYMTGGSLSCIVGMLVLKPLSDYVGKRSALILLLLAYTVVSIAMYYVAPDQRMLIYGLYFAASFAFGPMMPLLWSMYADAADYSEWKTGRRSTGLLFAASSSSQKFGWALAGTIAAWLLGYVGFEANQAQTAQSLGGIRMLMSYVPAGLSLVAAGICRLYALDHESQRTIASELSDRRAASTVAMTGPSVAAPAAG